MSSDERTKRRVAQSENGRRAEGTRLEADRDHQSRPGERKEGPREPEWRGAGVCSDKHTD